MELKLGATIKKLRTERGITQEELANKIGVSFQAVSKWETNATTPDIAILPRLALYFGVSIDALFSMNQDDYLEKISNMIRDEYSISTDNFVWAERYLNGVLSEEQQNNSARTLLVELYNHRINRDLINGARLCEEGLSIDPSNEALWGNLILIREKRGEQEKLIRFLKKLNTKNPQCDIIFESLVSIYIKCGNIDEAITLLNKTKNHSHYEVYFGDVELALGNREKAKAIWNSAVKKNKKDHNLLFKIAERFKNIGEPETAISLYKQSYEIAPIPKEMDALYSQAFLYTENKMNEKAIQVWQTIIKVLSDDYGITDGECVDWAKREIEKLRNQNI